MSTNTKRIGKELLAFQKAGHQTLFLHALNDDLTNLRALIFGPPETPFEGSFLYFEILPIDYPNQPPKVKFLTPDTELCRMHPNLYASGKVCLSILGTWGKWEWSPLLTFEKILITIQGILDNNPLTNEPGFERLTLDDEKAREYAINSRWLVLKTVISMLGREDVPQPFREEMNKYFVRNFDSYVKSLKLLEEHEGKSYRTIHGEHIIKFKQLFQTFENKYKELTN
jgi:ubiquitin-conjugating enzyme E2 Z